MPIDLPPYMHDRIVCSVSAATKYEIPANIVLAIAEKENGRAGQWVRNRSNGSYDVGPLQLNTYYLRELAQYGITPSHAASAGCYPFDLAAWRLRKHIKYDNGDIWTRAANYHSRTPRFNQVYRADLMVRAAKWADWLDKRYRTHDLTIQASAVPASAATIAQHTSPTPSKQVLASPKYVPRQLIVSVDVMPTGDMR